MSGFEVVGVVLGAIPLILEVIKKYQSIKDYSRELKTLKRSLETEYVILQDTCEKLLISIVPVHRIASFLRDPFGPQWKNQDTQALLQRRLWNSYRLFEETVQEMKQAITRLGKMFGLNIMTQAGVTADQKDITSRIRGKILWFLKRAQIESCMEIIEKGNSTLTKLLTPSVDKDVEAARQDQSRGRFLKLARQCSSNVLSALETSISCPCRTTHSLNLKLPLLSSFPTPTDNDQEIVSNVSFEVTFASGSLDNIGMSTLPKWKEIELRTHLWEQKTLHRSEIFLGLEDKSSRTALKNSSTKNNDGIGPSLPSPKMLEITNLCSEIDAARDITSQVDCYGLIKADSPLIKHLFRVSPGRHNFEFSSWSGKSLETLLVSRSQNSTEWGFRQKLILAVKVASSVLQFSESRWLPDFLTSADIAFMEKADASFFEHPFVIKRLHKDGVARERKTEHASGIPHELLFSIGVVLLEVALDKSMDCLRRDSGIISTTAGRDLLTDYEIAIKHLDRVEQAMGSQYSQAVRHCIKCEFMSPVLDLEEEGFRQEVYRKVIAPLDEHVSDLNM